MNKISIVIPVYNESGHIGTLVRNVIHAMTVYGAPFELLVIDDGSTDGTAGEAAAAGATVLRHPYNIGNGAAVKMGVRHAQGDVIVLMDGDGQHNPEEIPLLLCHIPEYDLVVGARDLTNGDGGVWYRNMANRFYNTVATYSAGRKIDDLTSGFRAMKAPLFRSFLYLLPNTYSYPSTLTLSTIRSGRPVKFVPITIHPRVGQRSKIRLFRDGVRFLNIILRVSVFFAPTKIFLPISGILFLSGMIWWAYRFFFEDGRFPPFSTLAILTSVIIFAIGLISEQITMMRYQHSESYTSE